MSRQSAERFIQVAERFSDSAKLPTVSTFAPTVLYALAAPSTPDEVITEVKIQRAARRGHKINDGLLAAP